jgi:hydrogenase expression/formation protein HypC
MKVIEIRGKFVYVEASGIRKEVNAEFLRGLKLGDYVMVHAGFAIEKFDPQKAEETINSLKEYEGALRRAFKR